MFERENLNRHLEFHNQLLFYLSANIFTRNCDKAQEKNCTFEKSLYGIETQGTIAPQNREENWLTEMEGKGGHRFKFI